MHTDGHYQKYIGKESTLNGKANEAVFYEGVKVNISLLIGMET